jgi:hypothetical protein
VQQLRWTLAFLFSVTAAGCSREAPEPQQKTLQQTANEADEVSEIRDPAVAARLAARYANEKCAKQWRREPFYPDLYSANLRNGRWHWGEYDPAGPEGFSVEVSFERDGKNPKVQVNFSTDDASIDLDRNDEGPADVVDLHPNP